MIDNCTTCFCNKYVCDSNKLHDIRSPELTVSSAVGLLFLKVMDVFLFFAEFYEGFEKIVSLKIEMEKEEQKFGCWS